MINLIKKFNNQILILKILEIKIYQVLKEKKFYINGHKLEFNIIQMEIQLKCHKYLIKKYKL